MSVNSFASKLSVSWDYLGWTPIPFCSLGRHGYPVYLRSQCHANFHFTFLILLPFISCIHRDKAKANFACLPSSLWNIFEKSTLQHKSLAFLLITSTLPWASGCQTALSADVPELHCKKSVTYLLVPTNNSYWRSKTIHV